MRFLRLLLPTLLTVGAALGQQSLNMAALKADIRVYEGIVQDVVTEKFTHPFALESQPIAAYLQDYGIVVSFHININRAVIRDPFGGVQPSRSAPQDPMAGKSLKDQIDHIREVMLSCLADYGTSIKQLSGHDRIVINAVIEDRNEINRSNRKTVVVMTAKKDDVDLLAMRRIDRAEFIHRVHTLQY